MSSSAGVLDLPITDMEYLDIGTKAPQERSRPGFFHAEHAGLKRAADVELSHEEFAARLRQERSEAAAQAEKRIRLEYEADLEKIRGGLKEALAGFETQRSEYFARVEAELVQLALSIAAKILHREAQVDPMLIAALVRITIEKMREESAVTVRVRPGLAAAWQHYFARHAIRAAVQIVEDPELNEGDCVVDTELGTTHLGLALQLKELEQGFFDLLALRPGNR